jgi:hypothetical protein
VFPLDILACRVRCAVVPRHAPRASRCGVLIRLVCIVSAVTSCSSCCAKNSRRDGCRRDCAYTIGGAYVSTAAVQHCTCRQRTGPAHRGREARCSGVPAPAPIPTLDRSSCGVRRDAPADGGHGARAHNTGAADRDSSTYRRRRHHVLRERSRWGFIASCVYPNNDAAISLATPTLAF